MNDLEITPTPPPKRISFFATIPCVFIFLLIFYFRSNQNELTWVYNIAFLAVVGLSIFFNRLETLILLILVITGTIFDKTGIPSVSIIIGDLYYTDMLIMVMLILRLLKKATVDVLIIPKSLGYPILSMIIVALITFLYTLLSANVPISRAGLDLRIFFYLFLFFLVIYYVRTPQQLMSLLIGIVTIACIYASIMIFLWITGDNVNITQSRTGAVLTAGNEYKDAVFVRFPGCAVILFTLNALLALYIFKGVKMRWRVTLLLAIALLALGIISTFSRTYWIAVITAIIVILLSGRKHFSVHIRGVLLIAYTSLIIFLVIHNTTISTIFNSRALLDRSVSIINAFNNLRDDTLYMRFQEQYYAWQKIQQYPLMGIGFGTPFRPHIFLNSTYERSSQGTWLHNGYLMVQMRMGLLGTLAFFWIIIAYYRRFRRLWRKVKDPSYRAVVVGVAVSLLGFLIINLTTCVISSHYWIVISAISMGITEKIYQFEGIS